MSEYELMPGRAFYEANLKALDQVWRGLSNEKREDLVKSAHKCFASDGDSPLSPKLIDAFAKVSAYAFGFPEFGMNPILLTSAITLVAGAFVLAHKTMTSDWDDVKIPDGVPEKL